MATTTLFLSGDVMTGRGVDQILPHPGDPVLREPGAGDAREYVRLAELKQGPLPRGASPASVWGAAGLHDTPDTLAAAGIATVGAGHDRQAAQQPALISLADGGLCVSPAGPGC